MNKITKCFQTTSLLPKNAVVKNTEIRSKSQKLLVELGLIKPTGNGSFHLLPLIQKSLDKCSQIIDYFMQEICAQKMTIPILTSADLWKKSGRWNGTQTELFTTTDRHNKLHILGPTHEEAITSLLASVAPLSYRQFPLKLYQIGPKFRDELKPRFGLMRAKEFIMKDCYSFDVSKESARNTYDEFNETYSNILRTIRIPFIKVEGAAGTIGGSLSHEFQYPSDVGENFLISCKQCGYSMNEEVCGDIVDCPSCQQQSIEKTQGIEIGHTFLLDDKYSKLLGATYLQSNGKPAPLQMGCYGIGITRLIAACLESLSLENELRWPFLLAPYSVCIIPPKDGSKEQKSVEHLTEILYHQLHVIDGLKNEVIVDDRNNMTIGKRLLEAKRMGYPIIIVIGPKAAPPQEKLEFHITNTNSCHELHLDVVVLEIAKLIQNHAYRN